MGIKRVKKGGIDQAIKYPHTIEMAEGSNPCFTVASFVYNLWAPPYVAATFPEWRQN